MTAAVYKVVKAFQQKDWTTKELAAHTARDFSSTSRIVRQLLAHELIEEKERVRTPGIIRATAVYRWVRSRVS